MLIFREELVRKVVVYNRGKILFFGKVFLIGNEKIKKYFIDAIIVSISVTYNLLSNLPVLSVVTLSKGRVFCFKILPL